MVLRSAYRPGPLLIVTADLNTVDSDLDYLTPGSDFAIDISPSAFNITTLHCGAQFEDTWSIAASSTLDATTRMAPSAPRSQSATQQRYSTAQLELASSVSSKPSKRQKWKARAHKFKVRSKAIAHDTKEQAKAVIPVIVPALILIGNICVAVLL